MSHAAPYAEAIESLNSDLAKLAAQRAEIRSAIGTDPKAAASLLPKMSQISAGERVMREQLAMLQDEHERAQRRDEADAFESERAGVQAIADAAVELAKARVSTIGKKLDKAFGEIAELLKQAEQTGGDIHQAVAQVAHKTKDGYSRRSEAISAARDESHGHPSNALVHAIVSAGIGRRGIPADIMIGGTCRPESFADAFSEAAKRIERRLADWIHQAATIDGAEPTLKRVRATAEGFDGLSVRKPGDTFYVAVHQEGTWFEATKDQKGASTATKPAGPADGLGNSLPEEYELRDGYRIVKGSDVEAGPDNPMALSQVDASQASPQ